VIASPRRVAILANSTDPFTKSFLAEINRVAANVRIATLPLMRRPNDDLLAVEDADALFVPEGNELHVAKLQVVTRSARVSDSLAYRHSRHVSTGSRFK
jgi:hypothetical protein